MWPMPKYNVAFRLSCTHRGTALVEAPDKDTARCLVGMLDYGTLQGGHGTGVESMGVRALSVHEARPNQDGQTPDYIHSPGGDDDAQV